MQARVVDLSRMLGVSLALTAAATLASVITGWGRPGSVALGGLFMFANVALIRMLVSRLIRPGASRAASLVLLVLKFLLMILLVVGVMLQFPVEPLSFAVGASMLLVAALLEAAVIGEAVNDEDQNGARS